MVGHPDHFADVSKMVSDRNSILPQELVPFLFFLLYVMRETA